MLFELDMIRDTSATDKPVQRRSGSRRVWIVTGLGLLLLGGGAVLYPSASRWVSAKRSVDESRVRIAQVVRGDLERDLGVQGRIVAAFHPTLYSPEVGIVRLLVDAGDRIRKGQELAVVDSPSLDSRLKQEESSLVSARAELDRRKIQSRQTELQNQQDIDLLDVQLQSAARARVRAEKTREMGLIDM
ncbi:MAG TPA: efflux transporter periplasmic adaptor subunit, partial [Patescibacteria group bacterium]|nr:efflux transporter periplasmic adaptor subunit [Patescibacteria group bacterium]